MNTFVLMYVRNIIVIVLINLFFVNFIDVNYIIRLIGLQILNNLVTPDEIREKLFQEKYIVCVNNYAFSLPLKSNRKIALVNS